MDSNLIYYIVNIKILYCYIFDKYNDDVLYFKR